MRFEKVACDRCGSEIDMTIPHKRDIWLSGKGREGGLDLCDKCYNEMFKWFMQVKIPENEDCPNTLCKEVKDISFCMDCVSYRHCEAVFMWIIKTMVKSYPDQTKQVTNEVVKEEPPVYADNETGYDKGVDLKPHKKRNLVKY